MSEPSAQADNQAESFAARYYHDYVLKESSVNTARTRQRVAAVLEMLGQRRGRLLSVGAGNLTEALSLREAGFEVSIADVADTQFDRARRAGIATHLIDLDRHDVPGEYDVVCCLEVLEHLVDPLGALRKLIAAVAPGGRLFVSLPDEFHIVSRLEILLGRPRFSRHDWHHLRFFNLRSARRLFRDAGATVLRTRHMPLTPAGWPRFLQVLGGGLARMAPGLFSLSHVFELEPPNRA